MTKLSMLVAALGISNAIAEVPQAGQYKDANDDIIKDCPKGTFQSEANQECCTPCAMNAYQDKMGEATCHSCASDHHTMGVGQVKCMPNSIHGGSTDGSDDHSGHDHDHRVLSDDGHDNHGATTNHDHGFFLGSDQESSDQEAAVVWEETAFQDAVCKPKGTDSYLGWASIGTEVARCVPGTYQDANAPTCCKKCAEGTFAATFGSIACGNCPADETSADGAKSCIKSDGSESATEQYQFFDASAKDKFSVVVTEIDTTCQAQDGDDSGAGEMILGFGAAAAVVVNLF